MVIAGLAPSLLASILNKSIVHLNLFQSELVTVKNANDAKREWVERSDQSIDYFPPQ
jgi:hypothetical protein